MKESLDIQQVKLCTKFCGATILSLSGFIYFFVLREEITEFNIFIQFWIISSFLNIGSRTIYLRINNSNNLYK